MIGVQDDESTPISIRRRYSSKTARIQATKISQQDLGRVKDDKLIRRIDGYEPVTNRYLIDEPEKFIQLEIWQE